MLTPQDRAGTNSPLDFNVVGGWEVVNPIFVSKVEPHSIPDRAGLRVGDQVGQLIFISYIYIYCLAEKVDQGFI